MVRVLEGGNGMRKYRTYRILGVMAGFVLLALLVIAERIW